MHHLAVPESDEAYLTAQLETCRDRHALTNAIDQRFHVRCRRAVAGLDEVGVFVRNVGAADPHPAQADAIDQLTRGQLAGDRVDEHRAGVLPAGLVLPPPADDLGDLTLGSSNVTDSQLQFGRQDDLVVAEIRSAKSQPERFCRSPRRPTLEKVEDLDAKEAGGDVGAVAAGVHPNRPSYRTWYTDRPFESGESGGGGSPRQDRKRDR